MHPDYVGRVEGVYLGGGDHASTMASFLEVSPEGIYKDRHFGHSKLSGVREKRYHPKGTRIWNGRQWSAVTVGELDLIAEEMGLKERLKAEWLGANLLLSGLLCFTSLPPLTRLVFPDHTTLLVYAANPPCVWPAETMEREGGIVHDTAKRFGKAAQGKRGLVGWVERGGAIHLGDEVRVFLPQPPSEEE
jgi:hypothetical protein